jgi:VWFA-related protein
MFGTARVALLVGALLPLAAVVRAQAAPPSDVTFPGGLEVVTVDAVVLDEAGQPVPGLSAEDFRITEDDRPQAITSFEAIQVPESAASSAGTRSRVSVSTRPAAVERTFVIVFDDLNLTALSAIHARDSVRAFVHEGLRGGDQVMVVPTSGGAWWSGRIPEERASLAAFVDRQQGLYRPDHGPDRILDYEANAIWNERDRKMMGMVSRRWFENGLIPEAYPIDREIRAGLDVSPGLAMIRAKAQETYRSAVGRLQLTLRTLTRIAESMGGLRGRKNLMLVSEGFIMDPSQPEFRELVQAARRSNTAVNFLDARPPAGTVGAANMPGAGAESGRAVMEQDSPTLLALSGAATEGARSIALDTGGSVVPATAGLGRAMTRIAEQTRAYYLLGYLPSNPKRDGAFRKIKVELKRPGGYEVRARRGYYAPRENEKRREDPERLDPRVRAALDAPFAATAIPLRVATYSVGPGENGTVPVLLLAEADVEPLGLVPDQGRVRTTLETFVVVHRREGGEPQRQEKLLELDVPEAHWEQVRRSALPMSREFRLVPGVYQARLLVRERDTGRIGTVRHEFEVGPASGLRMSSPILTDVFTPGEAGRPARPVPTARRTFPPGARLGFAYEVYGATSDPQTARPRLAAGYLIRRHGVPVTRSAAQPLHAAGMNSVSQVIVLQAPAEAGDYELVLQVTDEPGGASMEVVEPFTIG